MEESENCSNKRARLEKSCVVCGKPSCFTDNAEEYTKLLIYNLVSPFERDVFIKSEELVCFEFCEGCESMLNDVYELTRALQFISNNIKTKIQEIKFSILKNGKTCSSNVDDINFRTFATRDMCPVVRLNFRNILIKNKPVFEDCSSNSEEFYCNAKIRSQMIQINPESYEYFEDEEEVVKFEPWEEQFIGVECHEDDYDKVNYSTVSSSNENNLYEYTNTSCPKNSETDNRDWNLKPILKYYQLAIIALSNSVDQCSTFENIYEFIRLNFPYFKNVSSLSRCLKQALSLKSYFKREDIFWSLNEPNSLIIEEILALLKSLRVLQTMAFPDQQKVFIERLLNINKNTLPENDNVNATNETVYESSQNFTSNQNVQEVEGQWLRPPFPLSQIIFIALSNCEEKRSKTENLVQCIRNTFPFFLANNPVKTWKQCLHTTLFINKCFARAEITRSYDPINDIWTIDEKEAGSIRIKIKEVLESEKLSFYKYMATPELSLKNALSPVCEATKPNNANKSLKASKQDSDRLQGSSEVNKDTNVPETHCPDMNMISKPVCQKPNGCKKWQRPPFKFADIVFIALSNCQGKQGNSIEIVERIRTLFPWFLTAGLAATWEKGLTRVLLGNEVFIRVNEGAEVGFPVVSQTWTINEKVAHRMRSEIRSILETTGLNSSCQYIIQPDETIRKALIVDKLIPPARPLEKEVEAPIIETKEECASSTTVMDTGTSYSECIDVEVKIEQEEVMREATCSPIAPAYSPVAVMEDKDLNKKWSSPPFTMSALAAFVLANTKEKSMTGFSICDAITSYFPYFQNCRRILGEKVLLSLLDGKYFVPSDKNNLRQFSLNTQNIVGMTKLKEDMYQVFKQFYGQTFESFYKPSELYPMLKNIMGDNFDFSFLQSVTVYRQVE